MKVWRITYEMLYSLKTLLKLISNVKVSDMTELYFNDSPNLLYQFSETSHFVAVSNS